MKKVLLITAIVLFATSCQTTATNTTNLSDILDAVGKEWKLVELQINNKTEYTRILGVEEKLGEVYSILIDEETVSGTGAPNRYSAPYAAAEDDPLNVKIAVVRSTLMAPINQPEKLKEHDFFNYIQNTYRWGLSNEKLFLYSNTNDGASVLLIFSL